MSRWPDVMMQAGNTTLHLKLFRSLCGRMRTPIVTRWGGSVPRWFYIMTIVVEL